MAMEAIVSKNISQTVPTREKDDSPQTIIEFGTTNNKGDYLC
jgi:hypothetical protein